MIKCFFIILYFVKIYTYCYLQYLDMPLHKWYQILCQKNSHFEYYQRPYNNSWIIFDKSVPLEALDIHSELDTSSSSTTTPYLALTVHNHPKDNITSTWVPLLVGYTVIIR